jgi:hypothetical protein
MTHGATFCAGAGWNALCEGTSTRWPTASEKAMAPIAATAAATRNNEQKMRRQDVNV